MSDLVCELCGSEQNIDQHHTNYERDETVPLCRSCHKSVHCKPDHELYPDDPENAKNPSIVKIDGDVWDRLREYSQESGVRMKHVATIGVDRELERRQGENDN